MIRVLQVLNSLNAGGAESFVMNLYHKIDRDKIQFDFIISDMGDTVFKQEVLDLGGKIYYIPAFNGLNYTHICHEWNLFFKTHKEYKILHSHIRSYASLFIPIAKKYGLITIIHSHSTSNGSGVKAIGKKLLQLPLRFQADYFISCSTEAGEWLFGKSVVASKRHLVVKNAIDIDKYSYKCDIRNKVRKDLNLVEKTVLGHVGGFRDPKNHEFLIDIFSMYHTKNQNSMLVMVGDGELKKHVEDVVEQRHLEDSVVFLGARNDVPDILQAFDYYIFPSKWEGLPVSVIEAQASGLYCFISNAITSDVILSPLVKRLPIDNGPKLWVDNILNTPVKRSNFTQELKNEGFDMNEVSNNMMCFYSSIIRNRTHILNADD